jgi:hypothetical protein
MIFNDEMLKYILASCLLMLSHPLSASASDVRPEVIWGGLGISSSGETTLAPIARSLLSCTEVNETGNCPIEEFAKSLILETDFDKVNVVQKYSDSNLSYLASPIVDVEWVNRVELEEGSEPFVYQFIVAGSLIVYEVSPTETQLLFSVPMTVYADRYYSRQLSEQQEADVFNDMYLNADTYKGEVGYYNFFHNLVNEAKAVLDRPMKWPNNVQFTGVSYSSDAELALAGEVELAQLSKLFATWATANLAEATGEPIIPASMGENKLTLVMRDASRQIVLPKPYYEFDMHVQALETYKNSQYTCFDVASYFGVKVSGGEMLLDAPIQHGENSCAFLESGSAKESNIYPANIMSQIQQVMFGFSQNTSDMAYIESHIVGDTNAVLNSIEKVKKEVFNGG